MKSSLIALVSLVIAAGCAREAAPVNTAPTQAASVSPYAHLESVGLWRDCDGHCGAPKGCIELADAAFYKAGGGRSGDAAYEDVMAKCDEREDGSSPDVEHHTIPAGLDAGEFKIQLAELIEDVGCGDPIASKREADGSMSYAFSCPNN